MYKLKELTEGMNYYANGFSFRLVCEEDGWWSIYRLNEFSGQYMRQLQARDLQHAKSYCDLCEPKVVPIQKLC